MGTLDLIIIIVYCLVILGVGLYVSRRSKENIKSEDYFLAGRGLAWWAIGASIIASNISAEQIVGMSGSGYAIGLAMATYEWIAALGLLIVAKWFIPIFLKRKICTMPQFLEQCYDKRVKILMAVFWLFVFVFINLTSILYLGALVIQQVVGVPMVMSVVILALFTLVYSVKGGLKAVVITDVIQVVFLIIGGLLMTYFALDKLSNGEGILQGAENLYSTAKDKFHLILKPTDVGYKDLPGLSVIIGGLWVSNLYYWGCNQYIIQRALAAKSIKEAQRGMAFAGVIKLFVPFLVVIPGIVAFSLNAPLERSDEAYPWLLNNLLPVGIKGISFAALIAAIVSSLASMTNSIATIFTMDICSCYVKMSQRKMIKVGKITSVVAIFIAAMIAPLLSSLDQVFQYIQEFTGFVSPGALTIFLAGLFYKRATANGALTVAISSFVLSILLKLFLGEIPWMDRMGIVFVICCVLILLMSKKPKVVIKTTCLTDKKLFHTDWLFNSMAIVIVILLILIYSVWW